ncbi:AcrR family transcriptional regulator [Nitrospira sp.]|nr:AcrR family transcriptional regulator [Nitrospira sp.]
MVSKRLLTKRIASSAPSHRNGRRTSAQDRQASLIGAAASLFAAKGFSGTTTKDIAKAAGVSEALLFKHFPTKHALYSAILAEKAQYFELRQAVEEAALKQDDRRLFTTLASFRIRKGADPTLLRLLLFSALEGHEMSKMFFQQQYRIFYDLLAGYIRRRTADGAFRKVDPLLAARAFFGIIVHHRLLHDIFGLPMHRTHEDMVQEYVEMFLVGLIQPDTAPIQEAGSAP